jgi:hypothetical protein
MNFYTINRFVLPVLAAVAVVYAYQTWGWAGLWGALGMVVMWLLLHFSRMMQVLKRTANRPVGYVDSAVMLNAKMRKGMTLLHVLAMTRALGQLQSPKDAQPEVFRWTDNSDSYVDAVFAGGRLQSWGLTRPVTTTPE